MGYCLQLAFAASEGLGALGGENGAAVNSPVLLAVLALLTEWELFLGEQNELLGCKWANLS